MRSELRRYFNGTLRVDCVVDGVAVSTSVNAEYSVLAPDGTDLGGGTVSPTTSGGVSYYSVPVDAVSKLYEACRLTVTWDGNTTVSFFDVVTSPWSDVPRPTLADLKAVRPDVGDELDRLGVLLGYTSGATAQNAACASFTAQARTELDQKLRAQAVEVQQIRPALILDRDRLRPIETFITMALIYESLASNPNDVDDGAGDDAGDSLARYYRKRAHYLFTSLRCEYDTDQDLLPDGPPSAPAVGAVRVRRV